MLPRNCDDNPGSHESSRYHPQSLAEKVSCGFGHCATNCSSGHGTPCMQVSRLRCTMSVADNGLRPSATTRAPAPPAVLITLRSSGSGPGSGRGAKTTRLDRGWQCDAHQLNPVGSLPSPSRHGDAGERLRLHLCTELRLSLHTSTHCYHRS